MNGFGAGLERFPRPCFDAFGAGQAISGVANAAATYQAAKTQADAVKQASQQAQDRYNQTRTDLQPFAQAGQQAFGQVNDLLPTFVQNAQNFTNQMGADMPGQTLQDVGNFLPQAQNNSIVPGSMSQAELEATPGYQFNLSQGQQAVASSAAARGLGVSGAALKGAATFATGLADNTYMNQFNIKQQQFSDQLSKDNQNFGQGNTNFNNILNLRQGQFNQQQTRLGDWNAIGQFSQGALRDRLNFLSTMGTTGESAAAQTGSIGASLANNSGNQQIAGATQIGNTISQGANALSGSINGYLNNRQQQKYVSQLSGNGTPGGDLQTGGLY